MTPIDELRRWVHKLEWYPTRDRAFFPLLDDGTMPVVAYMSKLIDMWEAAETHRHARMTQIGWVDGPLYERDVARKKLNQALDALKEIEL